MAVYKLLINFVLGKEHQDQKNSQMMHIMKNGVFSPNALPTELPGLTQALAGQFGSDAPGSSPPLPLGHQYQKDKTIVTVTEETTCIHASYISI